MKKILISIKNNEQFNLKDIFNIINKKNYFWYTEINNDQTEIFYKNNIYDFNQELITLEELNSILVNDDYYTISLKIDAYKTIKSETQYNIIKNKNDFYIHDCEFIFRIFDCSYYQFIIKDDALAELLYTKLLENSNIFDYIEYESINNKDIFLNF